MVQQSFATENGILSDIKEGMTVYDSENQKLGTVYRLYFGSSSQTANDHGEGAATTVDPDMGGDSLIKEVWKGLFADKPLPEVLQARLIRNGFIRIDGKGLFAVDRYAMPEQIANVAGQDVHLKVTGDSLIKH